MAIRRNRVGNRALSVRFAGRYNGRSMLIVALYGEFSERWGHILDRWVAFWVLYGTA